MSPDFCFPECCEKDRLFRARAEVGRLVRRWLQRSSRERTAAWPLAVVAEVMRSRQSLDMDVSHLTSVIRDAEVGHSVWNH